MFGKCTATFGKKSTDFYTVFSSLKLWWPNEDFAVFDVLGTVDYYLCVYVLYDCPIVTLYVSHILLLIYFNYYLHVLQYDCSIVSITFYVSHILLLIYY